MSTPFDKRALPPQTGGHAMRLAVSPEPQDPMRGQPRSTALDHTMSFLARQHDPRGAPLKQQHDGAKLGPTYNLVHSCSMSVKPSING